MSITAARIYILNTSTNEFEKAGEFTDKVIESSQLERFAHFKLMSALEQVYPGQWCYRYATFKEGITLQSPGAIRSDYGNKDTIDGVTSVSLIADDGFDGQFQWINGGAGTFVPGYVKTDDPERDARYATEREARLAREEAERQALYAKVAALPAFQPKDAEAAALWETWREANPNTIFTYAENWARLMQAKIDETRAVSVWNNPELRSYGALGVIVSFADSLSHEADVDGMSGATHGVALQALTQAWVFGDELRRWRDGERIAERAAQPR